MHLQAPPTPVLPPTEDAGPATALPVTDVSASSLIDVSTPLENQEGVQNTLETQQQHAAVYSPGSDATPEPASEQIAAVPASVGNAAGSKAPGMDQWLSKHAKRDQQQLANSKIGKRSS